MTSEFAYFWDRLLFFLLLPRFDKRNGCGAAILIYLELRTVVEQNWSNK
jgi:hypothetical protein